MSELPPSLSSSELSKLINLNEKQKLKGKEKEKEKEVDIVEKVNIIDNDINIIIKEKYINNNNTNNNTINNSTNINSNIIINSSVNNTNSSTITSISPSSTYINTLNSPINFPMNNSNSINNNGLDINKSYINNINSHDVNPMCNDLTNTVRPLSLSFLNSLMGYKDSSKNYINASVSNNNLNINNNNNLITKTDITASSSTLSSNSNSHSLINHTNPLNRIEECILLTNKLKSLDLIDSIIERMETEKLLAYVKYSNFNEKPKEILNDLTIKSNKKEPKYFYKVVAVIGSRYYSIYDGTTRYELNKALKKKILLHNKNGFFVHDTIEGAIKSSFPNDSKLLMAARALLKLSCSGSVTSHSGGNYEFEKICPLEVITYLPFPGYKPPYPTLNTSLSNDLRKSEIAHEYIVSHPPPKSNPQDLFWDFLSRNSNRKKDTDLDKLIENL